MGEDIPNFADLVLGKNERRRHRRVASYLQRLATALDDQHRFSEWESAKDAAEAVRAVLSEDEIGDIADRLGVGARRVIEVAALLKKGRAA